MLKTSVYSSSAFFKRKSIEAVQKIFLNSLDEINILTREAKFWLLRPIFLLL